MNIIFTSFRDSMGIGGLKFSIDKHTPKLCSYPTLEYLIIPMARNLTGQSMERICHVIMDNNWDLIKDFLESMDELGVKRITLCDWATKEQISHGKLCPAGVIGRYIMEHSSELGLEVELEYKDGREVL